MSIRPRLDRGARFGFLLVVGRSRNIGGSQKIRLEFFCLGKCHRLNDELRSRTRAKGTQTLWALWRNCCIFFWFCDFRFSRGNENENAKEQGGGRDSGPKA